MSIKVNPAPGAVGSDNLFKRKEIHVQMCDREGRFLVLGNEVRIVVAPLRSCPLESFLDVSMSLDVYELNEQRGGCVEAVWCCESFIPQSPQAVQSS